MQTTIDVQCPWCFEQFEIWVDPTTKGTMYRDCEVCCRPWELCVDRGAGGQVQVTVRRGH